MSEDIVRTYFRACTSGSAADISACFSPDAIVYDTNHDPVRGSESIGLFWAKIRDKWTDTKWTVDSFVGAGDAAAIEWSMQGVCDGERFTVRGSEHYEFAARKISEIRQYWTFDAAEPGSELRGYPYAE